MRCLGPDIDRRLPLAKIDEVVFYKRDLLTTDRIYCDVKIADKVLSFHEELAGWDLLIDHLQHLPDFRVDWFASVSQPPFSTSKTVAFRR